MADTTAPHRRVEESRPSELEGYVKDTDPKRTEEQKKTIFNEKLSEILNRYPYMKKMYEAYPYEESDLGTIRGLSMQNGPGVLRGTSAPFELSEALEKVPNTNKDLEILPGEFTVQVDRGLKEKDPERAARILGHEYAHTVHNSSPSMFDIIRAYSPTPVQLERFTSPELTYPEGTMFRESLVRSISPSTPYEERWIQTPGLFTNEQQAVLGHLIRLLEEGPESLWSGRMDPSTNTRDMEPGRAYRYLYNRSQEEPEEKSLE